MKKVFAAAVAMAGICLFASEPVTVKMNPSEMDKASLMKMWNINKTVNKVDELSYEKDVDGTAFIRGKNWMHIFNSPLYPLAPGDEVEITVTARGKGNISLTYYCFDATSSFGYGPGKNEKLTDQWKTYTFKKQSVVNKDKKTGKVIYPGALRPLISFVGAKDGVVDIKDFCIKITPNTVFPADFSVNQPASEGIPEFKDGEVKVPGKLEYQSIIRKSAMEGTVYTYTFKAKGKGVVACGAYLHASSPAIAATSLSEVKIDSADWKDYTASVKCTSAGSEKPFTLNSARKVFRILPADGSAIELKEVKFK